ncbi:MAG: hypothetical protein KAQ85_02300 [Thermodesulfovibrionia bacterium]|nr:hypothetical protein [Thermodesulfovibrionia bacterium]
MGSSTKVTAFEASDGSLFKTKDEAEAYDGRLDRLTLIKKWVGQEYTHDMQEWEIQNLVIKIVDTILEGNAE